MTEYNNKLENDLEERNFDFKRFFIKYLRYWYVFIITLVLAFFIARYYNWYTSPIYKASCQMIVKDENANNSAENILKDLSSMKHTVNLENEIQILKSKSLISKAIKDLELNITYLMQGNIKSTELYTKSPFIVKTDTLNELAYFVPLNVTIIDQNSFQISYKINKDGADKSKIHAFGEKIVNDLGEFSIIKRPTFDNTLFNTLFNK